MGTKQLASCAVPLIATTRHTWVNAPSDNANNRPRACGRPINADRIPEAMEVENVGDRIRIMALQEAKVAVNTASKNRRQLMAGIMANNAKVLAAQEAKRSGTCGTFTDSGLPTPVLTPEMGVCQMVQGSSPQIDNGDIVDLPEHCGQFFCWPTTWNGRQECAYRIFESIIEGSVFLSEEQWAEVIAMFYYRALSRWTGSLPISHPVTVHMLELFQCSE